MHAHGDLARAGAHGAIAGTLATVAMTVVMEAGQRTGLLGKMPPRRVAEEAVAHVRGDVPPRETDALAAVLHVAIGAAAGATYGVGRLLVRPTTPAPLSGALFAVGFWAVSYVGVIPALRILPPPTRDRPGRAPVMVAAHVVFGLVAGALVRWLERRAP